MASSSNIATKRKEYEEVKREYKKAGKKAFGKPKSSPAYKEYNAVKKIYKQVGGQLGRLTGLKAKRGR